MAEKVYSTSKLINLHSADGSTLLIPKIPLSTVDNNAYTVVVDEETGATSIVTKGAGVSLQAAVQAEIAAAIADDVVGNYVPWTDGSNVEIPGTLTVEGATTLAALSAADTDITGTLDVTGAATLGATLGVAGAATLNDTLTVAKAATLQSTLAVAGKATLSDELSVAKAATFSSNVVVQGKLTVAQEYKVDELTRGIRQAEVATQNYVQTYVADQIAGVPLLSRKIEADATIISAAPTKENLNIIYMIPQAEAKQAGKDIYDEYMAFEAGVDDEENTIYKWQLIGNTDVDLSGYYTSAQVDQKLGDLAEEFAGSGLVTKAYVDAQDADTSTAAVTAANDYTDDALANYFDKDYISASYVPWTNNTNIIVPGYLEVAESADLARLTVGDSSTLSGTADIYGDLNAHGKLYASDYAQFQGRLDVGYGALAVNTSAGEGSTVVTMGDVFVANVYSSTVTMGSMFKADLYSSTVTMGSMFEANLYSSLVTMGTSVFQADLYNSTVKVYDEWQVPSEDGSSMVASSGLAGIATEHDISNIMSTINALPGVGEGAILYDIIEDEQI